MGTFQDYRVKHDGITVESIQSAPDAAFNTIRTLQAEVRRLNADLDHEAREHQVTHERWMRVREVADEAFRSLRAGHTDEALEYLRGLRRV